ncbi:hypothetical protein HJG60_010358 [Phyllostomus discolor]|uniref:Uncharacterized protein n=1 Tax=Phyllostomus discolor TaxID=89673 RepID=A0A834AWY4_9CHIR|nr:hypothetical protein HJG60_010358 [Phyllostomus discolor]
MEKVSHPCFVLVLTQRRCLLKLGPGNKEGPRTEAATGESPGGAAWVPLKVSEKGASGAGSRGSLDELPPLVAAVDVSLRGVGGPLELRRRTPAGEEDVEDGEGRGAGVALQEEACSLYIHSKSRCGAGERTQMCLSPVRWWEPPPGD